MKQTKLQLQVKYSVTRRARDQLYTQIVEQFGPLYDRFGCRTHDRFGHHVWNYVWNKLHGQFRGQFDSQLLDGIKLTLVKKIII